MDPSHTANDTYGRVGTIATSQGRGIGCALLPFVLSFPSSLYLLILILDTIAAAAMPLRQSILSFGRSAATSAASASASASAPELPQVFGSAPRAPLAPLSPNVKKRRNIWPRNGCSPVHASCGVIPRVS